VAAFALELMQGVTYTVLTARQMQTATCMTCHNTSADSVIPAQQGNMECGYCHGSDAVIVGKTMANPAVAAVEVVDRRGKSIPLLQTDGIITGNLAACGHGGSQAVNLYGSPGACP
jgi:hypothetical protein